MMLLENMKESSEVLFMDVDWLLSSASVVFYLSVFNLGSKDGISVFDLVIIRNNEVSLVIWSNLL